MAQSAMEKLIAYSMEPERVEQSIAYLQEHLGRFLRKREKVLICFQDHKNGGLSWLMEQAVNRCGAIAIVWGPDRRWSTLLRQAFTSKASVFIGAPLIALGLTKLKKAAGIPLYIRKVVTSGYPCLDWMIDGIVEGFDCEMGGCFSLGVSSVVAGFACGKSWGVHLRDAEYGVDIVDDRGDPLPPGELGEIVLYPKAQPQLRCSLGEFARMETEPCPCGCQAVRLLDFAPGKTADPDLLRLGQELQSWTSILDCRLNKGECGLEVEMIVFPGEKLPKLPNAAKRVIRPWDPETDEPFWYIPQLKKTEK